MGAAEERRGFCRAFRRGIATSRWPLLLALFSALAMAEPPARPLPDLPPTALPSPLIETRSLAFRPSMQPLFQAVAASARSHASAEVEVDYDASGAVTAIRMIRSSGSRALDGAVVAWARQMRLQPGTAGTGRLPFDFTLD